MAQPSLGVNTAQLGGADQRVDGSSALATAVGAGEQVVAPADGDTAQRPFGVRVIDLDTALVAVARQRRPLIQGVQGGRRRVRLAGQLFQRPARPALEVIEQGPFRRSWAWPTLSTITLATVLVTGAFAGRVSSTVTATSWLGALLPAIASSPKRLPQLTDWC